MPQVDTDGNHGVYFYMSSSLIYILEIHRRKFQTLVSDEDIMENNHVCYVMEFTRH